MNSFRIFSVWALQLRFSHIELIDSDDEVLVVMAEQLGIHIVNLLRHRQFPPAGGRTGVYRVRVGHLGEAVHNAGGHCPRGGSNEWGV